MTILEIINLGGVYNLLFKESHKGSVSPQID